MMEVLQKRIRDELDINCGLLYGPGPYTAWFKDLIRLEDASGKRCLGGRNKFHTGVALDIRVSNFGKLATIFGCTEEALNTYPVESLIRLVQEQDFNYVPREVLDTLYSGESSDLLQLRQRNYRWFDRFFFYPT